VELAFGNRRIHEVANKLGISIESLQSIFKDSLNTLRTGIFSSVFITNH
jgi:AraC-like DNA-binding protein